MRVEDDEFSAEGMQVLAIDANAMCLKNLVTLLQKCKYKVTATTEAAEALRTLGGGRIKFDIVIINVLSHDDFDSFKFLETVRAQFNLPVIIVSADDSISTIEKSMRYGAVYFLSKPVRINEARVLWQHAFRKRMQDSEPLILKPKIQEFADISAVSACRRRKPRIVWTDELHNKFGAAMETLGYNAKPKDILEAMNVKGISKQNIASHLQRCKLKLKNEACNHNLKSKRKTTKVIHNEEKYKQEVVGKSIEETSFLPAHKYSHPMMNVSSTSGLSGGGSSNNTSNYRGFVIENVRDRLRNQGSKGGLMRDDAGLQSMEQRKNTASYSLSADCDLFGMISSNYKSKPTEKNTGSNNLSADCDLFGMISSNYKSKPTEKKTNQLHNELAAVVMGGSGGGGDENTCMESANFMKQSAPLDILPGNSNFVEDELAAIIGDNEFLDNNSSLVMQQQQPMEEQWGSATFVDDDLEWTRFLM